MEGARVNECEEYACLFARARARVCLCVRALFVCPGECVWVHVWYSRMTVSR